MVSVQRQRYALKQSWPLPAQINARSSQQQHLNQPASSARKHGRRARQHHHQGRHRSHFNGGVSNPGSNRGTIEAHDESNANMDLPTSLPSHTIFIDKDGELRLVKTTAGRSTTFVVCPRTLARASGVWRQKLYGEGPSLVGSSSSSPWTIEVSDDVGLEALTILLYIAHQDVSKIPAVLGTAALRELILATEIYDMVSDLGLFIARWLRTVPGNPFSPRQLWIPWSLGHEALFLETARALVLCVSVDRNGRMHVPGHAGRDLELKLEEMGIAEQLRDLHRDTLADILRLLLTTIEHLEREPPALGSAHEDCQSAVLGRIVREVVQHGLWPLADIQLDRSIETTLSIIRRIQLPKFLDGGLHHGCNRVVEDMKKQLNRFERVTLRLKPSQALQLRDQAREMGLNDPRRTSPHQLGETGTDHNQNHTPSMMEIVEISDDD